MYIHKFFGHLKTVCVHRFWVCYYCFKAHIPLRGLLHDLSKFHPVEFFESVKYYTGKCSPIDICKKKNGYSKAWLHHKGHNKHHFEYWMDNFSQGGTPLQMPYKDSVEMLCDYVGAARAYQKKQFSFAAEWEWWKKKRGSRKMHTVQRCFLDLCFRDMMRYNRFLSNIEIEAAFLTAAHFYDGRFEEPAPIEIMEENMEGI